MEPRNHFVKLVASWGIALFGKKHLLYAVVKTWYVGYGHPSFFDNPYQKFPY